MATLHERTDTQGVAWMQQCNVYTKTFCAIARIIFKASSASKDFEIPLSDEVHDKVYRCRWVWIWMKLYIVLANLSYILYIVCTHVMVYNLDMYIYFSY